MVYLLHFQEAIGNRDKARGQAQHYIGYATDLGQRLAVHEAGGGAAITAYLVDQGISWELVRVWLGDGFLERRIKRRKDGPKLCPICNSGGWHRRADYSANWRPMGQVQPIEVVFEPLPAPQVASLACPF